MKLRRNQALWTSVILHGAVLLGLFIGTIVQAFRPKEKPHVFVMVDPPGQSAAEPSTPTPPEPDLPSDLPTVELTPVPRVEIPAPPSPPRPAPPRPSEPSRPAPPAPQPQSQMITMEEFLRNNPAPTPRLQPATPRPTVRAPQIEAPRLVVPTATANSSSPQLSQQQLTALADYSTRLRSRIDAAWTKPPQLAGIRLVAEVVFNVSPSGTISNVRLSPGSGNAAFDQSVLAAFRQAASAGVTPTGQSHEFRLLFRMRD